MSILLTVVYIISILALLLFLVTASFYLLFSIFISLSGFPFFVPTKNQKIREIFTKAKINENDFIIDIGSGDGRVLLHVSETYGISGLGIEMHPLLYFLARVKARLGSNKSVRFVRRNVLDTDISKATVVFLFLMPNLISILEHKFRTELMAGTLIISHGFVLPYFQSKLIQTMKDTPYPTYFYKL